MDHHAEAVADTPELHGEVAPERAPAPGRFRMTPGMRYMAAGAFCFSLMSLLVKLAGARLPTQEVVMTRAIVTMILSIAALRHARVPPWGTQRGLLTLRGVFGFLALSCFYHSLTHLPIADATVIQYTNPVYAGLLAVPLLGERLRRREVLSVFFSMVGVLLVMRPAFLFGGSAHELPPVTVIIGLAGAMCSAAAYITVRKLGRTEHPAVIISYFSVISVIASVPVALPGWIWPTATEWLVLLGIGVTTQMGQTCLTHGLRMERAGTATATAYLQIVFAALWGVLFFSEVPDAGTLLGAAVIVGSTLALAQRGKPAGPTTIDAADQLATDDDKDLDRNEMRGATSG
jgi:drug/metabolite transporter (DMT)-like permease